MGVVLVLMYWFQHPAMKGVDLSHVKWTVCGAAPLSGELVKQVIKVLPNASIGQGYGMFQIRCLFPLS